jgi:hypothetical protein
MQKVNRLVMKRVGRNGCVTRLSSSTSRGWTTGRSSPRGKLSFFAGAVFGVGCMTFYTLNHNFLADCSNQKEPNPAAPVTDSLAGLGLYPIIQPYDKGFLKVSDIHTIAYSQYGNPAGKPVLFIHGGPGAGSHPAQARFFDPNAYRIILVDQRGCGESTPFASLEENTTYDTIRDFEKLREKLKISKWQLFGGSWGSTLALAYAVTFHFFGIVKLFSDLRFSFYSHFYSRWNTLIELRRWFFEVFSWPGRLNWTGCMKGKEQTIFSRKTGTTFSRLFQRMKEII